MQHPVQEVYARVKIFRLLAIRYPGGGGDTAFDVASVDEDNSRFTLTRKKVSSAFSRLPLSCN